MFVFFFIFIRIVVDGDVIPGLAKRPIYIHFGSEVLIDGLGNTGSIIINPSSVERKLIQKTKTSVVAHSLGSYKNGLDFVKSVTLETTENLELDHFMHSSFRKSHLISNDIIESSIQEEEGEGDDEEISANLKNDLNLSSISTEEDIRRSRNISFRESQGMEIARSSTRMLVRRNTRMNVMSSIRSLTSNYGDYVHEEDYK